MKNTAFLLSALLLLFSAPLWAEDAVIDSHAIEAVLPSVETVPSIDPTMVEDALEHGVEGLHEADENAIHSEAVSHSAPETGHHGEEAEGGLPQFNPASFPSQIFWFFIVFIALYVIFSRKTLPEISKVIETRTEHIQNDLDTAQGLKEEAETIQQAYEDILDKARDTSEGAFSKVEQEIRERTEAAGQAFQVRASKAIKKAEKSVEASRQKILGEIDSIAALAAKNASEKIIGTTTDLQHAESIVQSLHGKKKAA